MVTTEQNKRNLPGFGKPVTFKPKGSFPGLNFQHKIQTLRERAMEEFMNSVTDKKDWETKIQDEEIMAKYRQEALSHFDIMSEEALNWCEAELL